MADLTTVLLCGCPALDDGTHQSGCWLAEAEAIAAEAVTANTLRTTPGSRIVAVVLALVEAGLLRDPEGDAEVLGLLDQLVEAGLLRAAPGRDTGRG